MKLIVVLGIYLIIFFVIVSLVVVICLIVKENSKTKQISVNKSSVKKEDGVKQSQVSSVNISEGRISDDDIDYLKKLKELKDTAVLSEEEYNTERDKIIKV